MLLRSIPFALLILLASCDRGQPSEQVEPEVEVDAESDVPDEPDPDLRVADTETDPEAADTLADAEPDLVICEPGVPSAAAQLPPGAEEGDAVLGLGGRGLETPGDTVEVLGFPSHAVLSADGSRAYVVVGSRRQRGLAVINVEDATLMQQLPMRDVFFGVVLSSDGSRLYVSGGATRTVFAFEISEDGTVVEEPDEIEVPGYASGLAITPDGARLFVGSFSSQRLYELDVTSVEGAPVVEEYPTGHRVWDVEFLPESGRLVTSTLHRDTVSIIDRSSGEREEVVVGGSPMGLAISADETTAWVAVSDADELVEVGLNTATVGSRVSVVAEPGLRDAEGRPYRRSNPNDVTLSADGTELYVTRGADNAVTVFDAGDLSVRGSFPTSWYPTGTVATESGEIVVLEGRGFGSGSDTDPAMRDTLDGNVVVLSRAQLDLEETTASVAYNFNRANEVFPFECDGFFPIPTRPGMRSPIEHVILIVKENKTFDCVFGDLEDMDVDVDPSLVRWGEDVTPNQHAIAREFTISDNFHVEAENSDMGHLVLTSGFLTDFMERVWIEAKRHRDEFVGYQVEERGVHETGNIFTHLMDHGVDIRVYGEIVGMFATAADGTQPIVHSDPNYPGGIYYNTNFRDTERAEYVLERIDQGDFASFTFMLMPNDHTGGTAPGSPTPESEVADNDEGVGRLIEGLSQSEYWDSTAVFILEDDPQGCSDHVDSHRSFMMIASPWARRGHVSHVNSSFQSVFATIFRILDVPPMGRPDASAAPLWDMFVAVPDTTPFQAIPRNFGEDKILDLDTPGAEESMRMDFRGPDRNPDLGTVLDAYRLWRMGRITREQAHAQIAEGIRSEPLDGWGDPDELEEMREELEEEAEEEVFAYDEAYELYEAWLAERGESMPEIHGAPIDEETIRQVMAGEIPIEQVQRVHRLPSRVPALVRPVRGGR